MKFKSKPVEIEAWREGCGEEMPIKLKHAVIDGRLVLPTEGEIGSLFFTPTNKWIPFEFNDWIIYGGGGYSVYNMVAVNDDEMRDGYEVME